MSIRTSNKGENPNSLIDEVNELNERVKALALNLALYLARARVEGQAEMINRMEPEFIRLVNGTVRVVQDLAQVLETARSAQEGGFKVPLPIEENDPNQIEARLKSILEQCSNVLKSLSGRNSNSL